MAQSAQAPPWHKRRSPVQVWLTAPNKAPCWVFFLLAITALVDYGSVGTSTALAQAEVTSSSLVICAQEKIKINVGYAEMPLRSLHLQTKHPVGCFFCLTKWVYIWYYYL